MPVDLTEENNKVRFYNRIYRTALLSLCVVGLIIAIYAMSIATQVVRQNKETNQKIDCIALFFTQNQRNVKRLESSEDQDIASACKIVPIN